MIDESIKAAAEYERGNPKYKDRFGKVYADPRPDIDEDARLWVTLFLEADRVSYKLLRMISPKSGRPYLRINKTKCPNLCTEFVSYIWNEKASERGQEEPLDKFNHALAALRYFVKTIVRFIPGVK